VGKILVIDTAQVFEGVEVGVCRRAVEQYVAGR
jgi:hypothetical protein